MSALKRAFELFREFGFLVMFVKALQACSRNIPILNYITGKLKYKIITNCLYKENKKIIEEFNCEDKKIDSLIGENSYVYVFWWQGFDKAPDIVQVCVESMKKYIGRKLVLLDSSNYCDYVKLDNCYIEMLEKNMITKTQFSDLLRLNLLYQNGGIWLDATYLMTGDFPQYISTLPFFTIRHGMEKSYPMSKGLWSSSMLAFGVKNKELRLFIDIYNNYFKRHNKLIDYLLTDYIFAVSCDHCKLVREMFERVPVNNENVNKLLFLMNKQYDENAVSNITKETIMNKLNRKVSFCDSIIDAQGNAVITVYGYFYHLYKRGN